MGPTACHHLSLLVFLAFVSVSGVRADPAESTKPYRLQVVLDVGKHRVLTDVFREQLRRELRDGLQASFGALAQVEVADTHPRLAEVRRDGLKAALDRWHDLTSVKTHFVLVDFVDGQYVLQARQHDGLTGLSSPVVRRDETSERPFVARLAALMVDRDFGLVGTVRPGEDGKTATVEVMGGGLGVPLDRWLQKGEVMVLVAVSGEQARRVEDAVLRAEGAPDKGTVSCALFQRFKNSVSRAGTYRCLKLATVSAPVRLHLVQRDADKPTPVANVPLFVRRRDFEGKDDSQVPGVTGTDGTWSSEREKKGSVFDRIAFVIAGRDDPLKAAIPVPIVGDEPVTLRISVRPPDRRGLVQESKALWEQQAYEAGLVQRELFKRLQGYGDKPKLRQQALDQAVAGLRSSEEARTQLLQERGQLVQKAAEEGVTLDFGLGDQCVKELEKGHAELKTYIVAQEKILKEETDPKRLEMLALVQQARLEAGRFEFDKALELYDRAIKSGYKDPATIKDYEKLSVQWKTKNAEHRLARHFIYQVWPSADLVKNRKLLEEARRALDECIKQNDRLAPLKFFEATVAHARNLQEQRKRLDLGANEEDRKTAEVIAEVSAELKKLLDLAKSLLEEPGEK